MAQEDPWDAFGDDDDENVNDIGQDSFESLALYLTQYFVKDRHALSLETIRIGIDSSSCRQEPLVRRGFAVVDPTKDRNCVDAYIVTSGEDGDKTKDAALLVIPGGLLIFPMEQHANTALLFPEHQWDIRNTIHVPDDNPQWLVLTKWPATVQEQTCPWLPGHYNVYAEIQRLSKACVVLTAEQVNSFRQSGVSPPLLPDSVIQAAVHKLQTYGYCVIPGLLDPTSSQSLGQAALGDLHEAAALLKDREGVDLMEPRNSQQEPANYRELSMREDLRMDLRHGPRLNAWRSAQGCQPWTVSALENQSTLAEQYHASSHRFLRGHAVILEIVRQTMNPVDPTLAPGNWGRYNFGGRGPDGSFCDLRVGPVGTIISLPGSADQALHADTPHLQEMYDCLPAHYINVFTPGCAAHPAVGQTALVHGSHRLSYTAALDKANENMPWVRDLVRPMLDLGDVLLFDCRILHFGLANTNTQGIERPLIYANMTQHWFHDPKNWDDRRPIFGAQEARVEE